MLAFYEKMCSLSTVLMIPSVKSEFSQCRPTSNDNYKT